MARHKSVRCNLLNDLLNDIDDPKERRRVGRKLKKLIDDLPAGTLSKHRQKINRPDAERINQLTSTVVHLLNSMLPELALRLNARFLGISTEGLSQADWLWLKVRLQAEHEGVPPATIINRAKEAAEKRGTETGGSKEAEPDLTGLVPMSYLWPSRFEQASHCNRFLNEHPEIRQHKPSKNRRLVHEGDYLAYWADHDRKQSDLLDNENVQGLIADIEARKLEERERKRLKDKTRRN